MNDNPAFESYASSYVNDICVIAQHDDFISINTAIEIDLYGQVNAEFIGDHGVQRLGRPVRLRQGRLARPPWQVDHRHPVDGEEGHRLQHRPEGGDGHRRAHGCRDGASPRHGAVNLRGKSTKERAEALIGIAHPDHRGELRRPRARSR